MVLLPYMNWGNLKLFLRQCKLVEANNPQVCLGICDFLPLKFSLGLSSVCVCAFKEIVVVVTMKNWQAGSLASVCLDSSKENILGCVITDLQRAQS